MEMLQGVTSEARAYPTLANRESSARSASMLVLINGRYAIALVLDGLVLCVVPAGAETMRSAEADKLRV
jgi:hypothetical protein